MQQQDAAAASCSQEIGQLGHRGIGLFAALPLYMQQTQLRYRYMRSSSAAAARKIIYRQLSCYIPPLNKPAQLLVFLLVYAIHFMLI